MARRPRAAVLLSSGLIPATIAAVAAAVVLSRPLHARQLPTPAPRSDSDPANPGDHIFGLTTTHQLRLVIAPAEWAALQTSSARNGGGQGGSDYQQPDGRLVHVGSGFGGYFPWARARLGVGDAEFADVGLRYKGNLSFMRSTAGAPFFANFKLKIDVYGTKGSWDDEKTFNLHAGVVDASRMREAVAFALFRAAGVPAPRTAHAEVRFTVPGLYEDTIGGTFTLVEDVNKRFLGRVLPPGTGLLMKPEGLRGGIHALAGPWSTYVPYLRPDRDATPHEQERVMAFAELISQTDVALFRANIGAYLDVEAFLRFLAVNAFIANWDSYLGGNHNFYLYLDPKDDKFQFIPWDQDLSMGSQNTGAADIDVARPYRGDQPLIYWLLDDPAVSRRYRAIVRELTATVFTAEVLNQLIDDLERVSPGRGVSPRTFLQNRVEQVQRLVAGWGPN